MTSAELLVDAFGRIREVVHQVGDGLTPKQLAFRVDPGGQLDRLAGVAPDPRIQDDHLADAFQAEQVWVSQGWVEALRVAVPPPGYRLRAPGR